MKCLYIVSVFACLVWQNVFAAVPQKLSQFPEGDRMVYSRLIESYRRGDAAAVTKQRNLMVRHYPKSVFLDNAYYLSGVLDFQSNRLGEALKSFDTVTDKFPLSNKRVSALFAMAMTYKKLNLGRQSHSVFKKIIKEYPGSPESQRAWVQLRMEKQL